MAGSPRDPGINVETLSRLITSILIGKHDIGSHSPLPSFPPVVGRGGGGGGGKDKKFQVYPQIPMLWFNIRLLV